MCILFHTAICGLGLGLGLATDGLGLGLGLGTAGLDYKSGNYPIAHASGRPWLRPLALSGYSVLYL